MNKEVVVRGRRFKDGLRGWFGLFVLKKEITSCMLLGMIQYRKNKCVVEREEKSYDSLSGREGIGSRAQREALA